MYAGRFAYVYGLLGLIAAAAVAALILGPAVLGDPVRVETEYRDTPALSKSASSSEARGRFAGEGQAIDGTQLGLPAGVTCDMYELKDGVALICH